MTKPLRELARTKLGLKVKSGSANRECGSSGVAARRRRGRRVARRMGVGGLNGEKRRI